MATPVDVNQLPPRTSESRGITTAAMLLLAAGVGLFGLESCTQAPEAKSKEPAVTDVKVPDVKPTDVKPTEVKPTEVKPTEVKPTEPTPPEPMPPPAT